MKKRRNLFLSFIKSGILLTVVLAMLLQSCNKGGGTENETTLPQEDSQTSSPAENKSEPKHYKAIYNSDTTHIMQCYSPYHQSYNDTPLTKKMVKSAVNEALDAGSDCFVITPGHCWVPWWPSQYVKEHQDWYYNEFKGNKSENPFWTYVHVKKHDFIQEQIEVCRERGAGAFINFRLNDAHMIGKVTTQTANIAFAAEIFVDHPEYAIGSSSNGTKERVLDFRHKEVRDYKLKLIKELIENYEIDGFELDFCRRFAFFNTDITPKAQRVEIMTSFVKEVRSYLDAATEKDGRYRHLSVRIPAWKDYYGDLGIDLAKFEEAGVTIFNFTGSYFMDQDLDLKALSAPIKNADTYYELQFVTSVDYDSSSARVHRRATPEQLYTTALIAYEQGVDGISFFNFQYYRGDRQGKGDEPLTEPPWEVIKNVQDIEFLKSQGQYYFYGQTWKDRIRMNWKLPITMSQGKNESFDIFAVSPKGSWSEDGVFRLQSLKKLNDRSFKVIFNGTVLNPTAYTGEAYKHEYTQMIGKEENYLCFKVPKELIKEGKNTFEVTMTGGAPVSICFVDFTVQ